MTIKYAKKTTLILYFILAIIDALQVVFIAVVFRRLFDFATHPSKDLIKFILLAMLGLFVFWIFEMFYKKVRADLIRDINLKIKSLTGQYLLFNHEKTIKIDTSFFNNDLKQIESKKTLAELSIIELAITFVLALATSLTGSIILTVIFLVASFIPAFLQQLFGAKIETASEKWSEASSTYTESVKETENIANTSQLYNSGANLLKRFVKSSTLLEDSLAKLNIITGYIEASLSGLANIFSFIVPMGIGIYLVSTKNITLGVFMMIVQLSNNFVNPILNIMFRLNEVKSAQPMWDKVQQIIDLEVPEEKDEKIESFKQLSVENIGVKLDDHTIFENISFNIKNGEKVLFVAPSGWGKSTLLNVLTGDNQIFAGQYEIDEKNLDGDWDDAHNYFSYIHQEPKILNDTLKYNITLGKNVSDEQLNQVIQKAGLTDLVNEKGLDSDLGINGSKLSGGQKQRVEIARALIFDRPILIADEATSALDKELSQQVHETLLKNVKGTVLEVAHKVSEEEMAMFDRVIKLNEL